MSLQLAAQHLSSQGRGNDSTLVHMSPREVKSLNDLAMAHGGQLSINPQTGLPEAGFLESILPMVAGFALNAAMPGAGMMVPALVGGGTALLTGSLGKGLMAGLGAYGGANLGQALAAQGVEQAAQASMTDAMREQAMAGTLAQGSTTLPNQVSMSTMPTQAAQEAALKNYDNLNFMDKMKSNFSTLTSPGGASGLFDKISSSPMSLLKTVGSAAAPAIGEALTPKKQEEEKADADMGQRYGFSMNPTGGQSRSVGGAQPQVQPGQAPLANTQSPTTTPFPTPDIYGREQRYFTPSYTKLTPEQAKSMYGYADGGVAQSNPQPAIEPFPMPRFTNEGKQPSGETPALQMFRQMQAQRAAQPPVPQIDANAQYQDYLKQTVNPPKPPVLPTPDVDSYGEPYSADNPRSPNFNDPLLQSQTPPASVNPGTEFIYDPAKQTYTKNPNFAAADPAAEAEASFTENWRPGVPYSNVDPKTGKWTNYDRYGQKLNANGGLMAAYAGGGMPTSPSSIGANANYPQAHTLTNRFSAPTQTPISQDVVSRGGSRIDLHTGEEKLAAGGVSHLGDYSDGGRLLRGPGDGVSDSIPAMIGKRQPARLADGEFVVPARIVSELGNGSTEAGARKLYAMMDRIQKARGKTVGKGKVAKNSRSEKYLPA